MKGFKGYGFFFILAAVILIAVFSNGLFAGLNQDNYSYFQFKKDMTDKKVSSVTVRQNPEVPTGEIVATLSDNKTKSFYAPDVNTVLTYLDTADFSSVKVIDVERTPWYLEWLPYVLGFFLIFLLFSTMTSQAGGGGGGNAKMMNFGKSRARMTAPVRGKGAAGGNCRLFVGAAKIYQAGRQNSERRYYGRPAGNR